MRCSPERQDIEEHLAAVDRWEECGCFYFCAWACDDGNDYETEYLDSVGDFWRPKLLEVWLASSATCSCS